MPSALEQRATLLVLTTEAVDAAIAVLEQSSGSPDARLFALGSSVPDIIGYYAEGAAALAADFYAEEREMAGATKLYVPELVIADRSTKIRTGIAWAAKPLLTDDTETAAKRLAEIVQPEAARPYRDTIIGNRKRDPEAAGWKRQTSGGCGFCRMLAARGAIYRESTVRFAAHPNCHCTAVPVFNQNDTGESADVLQYVASKKTRTPRQQAALRDYIKEFYPDH